MRAPSAEDVQRLIKKYSNAPDFDDPNIIGLDSRTIYGDQLLHAACVAGDIKDIKLMISLGADINSKGEGGYTPLHYAVEQGHLEVVKLLLQGGANLCIVNDNGESPVNLAEDLDEKAIKDFLFNHMA